MAKGEPVWGLSVKQGTTLYLCLEDSYTQTRLFQLTEDAPATPHFANLLDNIGGGLEEQIRMFLTEHSDTKLVVIDIRKWRFSQV